MLEIEQLVLRIQNISPEQGRQMSQEIARQLLNGLPVQHQSQYIQQMDIQIKVSDELSINSMANRISGAILNRINAKDSADRGTPIGHQTILDHTTPNNGKN